MLDKAAILRSESLFVVYKQQRAVFFFPVHEQGWDGSLVAKEELQDDVRTMLTTVVRSLVDRPQDVVIHALQSETSVTFQVQAHPSDMGKLIGVNGRTARALRIILGANAARLKRNLSLDILQVSGQN